MPPSMKERLHRNGWRWLQLETLSEHGLSVTSSELQASTTLVGSGGVVHSGMVRQSMVATSSYGVGVVWATPFILFAMRLSFDRERTASQ
jgi:hypothetical protein